MAGYVLVAENIRKFNHNLLPQVQRMCESLVRSTPPGVEGLSKVAYIGRFKFLWFNYFNLTMLLVSRLYSVDDRMINECETVGVMRIGRGIPKYSEKIRSIALCPPRITHERIRDRAREASD
jgi:hypothetical protein